MELLPTGFTYIKTPFMTLLHSGQVPIEDLHCLYESILEITSLADQHQLLDQLNLDFPGCVFEPRWFEYWCDNPFDSFVKVHNQKLILTPIEQKIFSPLQGPLIALSEGYYELIMQVEDYWLGLQRYYFADYFGEDIKKIQLDSSLLDEWKSIGITAIDNFVAQQRLQLWIYKPIWIIVSQDKVVSAQCSIAMDGSEFYVQYSCVPANSSEDAISSFTQHIEADFMSVMNIYDVKPFIEKDCLVQTESSISIIENAKRAFEQQKIISYTIPPYFMNSLLITPHATIISKWHCDHEYWSKRVDTIELCEFFPDKESCFQRLMELKKVSPEDQEEFNALCDTEDEPVHYSVNVEGKVRFEKLVL
jgi:hypothetical protein